MPCPAGCAQLPGLTNDPAVGTLCHMTWKLQRPDPDRRRRRLQLLAELADAKSAGERVRPQRARVDRLKELIATRRRLAN
jgi:hypothetical protein